MATHGTSTTWDDWTMECCVEGCDCIHYDDAQADADDDARSDDQ